MTVRRIRTRVDEFLREAAVLFAVFVPLDFSVAGELTVATMICSVVVSGGLLTCGILLGAGPHSATR